MIKRSSCFLGAAVLALTVVSTVSAASQFTDVKDHWAQQQIEKWIDKGFVKGYEDQTFKPNGKITRAEFVALINRSYDFTEKKAVNYTDVKESDWYADELAKAAQAGYLTGYNDGSVKPNHPITRQEAASMLARVTNLELSDKNEGLGKFKDQTKISSWALTAISAVVSKGFMGGYPDDTYRPLNSITRAEAITTLDRSLGNASFPVTEDIKEGIYNKEGIYGATSKETVHEGDVIISSKGVTLQNTVIKGNLLLSKEIGDGDVYLKQVKVEGTTTVEGGGSNSVHLFDSTMDKLIVAKKTGDVRIVASGKTAIQSTVLKNGAKLEEEANTGSGFTSVSLDQEMPSDSKVILAGAIDQLTVNASGVSVQVSTGTVGDLRVKGELKDITLKVEEDAVVKKLSLDSATKVTGQGKVEQAAINVTGCQFEKDPLSHTGEKYDKMRAGGGGGLGSVGAHATAPTASNFSLDGATFSGSDFNYSVDIPSSTKIHMLEANFSTDAVATFDFNGKTYTENVNSGKYSINIIEMLGLSGFDTGNDGISASHFRDYLKISSISLKITLSNQDDESKSNTYYLTVKIKD